MTWHVSLRNIIPQPSASTLVWTSQALGSGCCNPCPYRMHSFHWQFLSVKTESVSSRPLQEALSSPQWHFRVLCCSSKRSEITPVHLLRHCSGRLPLSTLLILNCAVAAGYPCLFNFPLFCTTNSGTYHVWQTLSSSSAMQKACSVMAVFSHVWEEGNQGELSIYDTGFSISSPFCRVFFAVILGMYLDCFRWDIHTALSPLEPTYAFTLFYLLLLCNYRLLIHT